ncbi:MAG: hypothetical protein U9Q22_02045 [Candidatus Altiarchaeota archaeon]|nr:hypothetical protein [Candidatus Altiarchaeota archaeon]
MTLKECYVCGRPVERGEYMEYGDKVICFKCPKPSDTSEKVAIFKTICPNCLKSYDSQLRRCPYCRAYNPAYDFPLSEFILNTFIGSIIIFVIFLVVMEILENPLYQPDIFLVVIEILTDPIYPQDVLLSPSVIIWIFISAISMTLVFYLGRWIRAAVFRG